MRSITLRALMFRGLSPALILVVSCFAHPQSQSAILAGIVKDSSDAEIPKAEIELKAHNGQFSRTTTDNRGSFTIVSTPGEYALTVTYPGFKAFTKTIHLTANAPTIEQVGLALSNCTNCATVCEPCGVEPQHIPELSESLDSLLPLKPLPSLKLHPRNYKNRLHVT
jgi:hypothetical protein